MQVRERILRRIADSLEASTDAILEANTADVAAMAGRIDQQLMQRLRLKPAKLQSLINSVQMPRHGRAASTRANIDSILCGRQRSLARNGSNCHEAQLQY